MKTHILFPFLISCFFALNSFAQKNDTIKSFQQVPNTAEQINNPPILTIVEQMPSFPGGEDALYGYLSNNIQYPQTAKETGISGTVIISFVVEQDGSLSSINIIKEIGGGCGAEAVRVIKGMPKWIPGKQHGVPVRVQFNLPIRFTLTD